MDFYIAVSTQLFVNTFMFVYKEIALVIHKQADFVNAKHAHLEMNTFEHMLRYSCIWMARYIYMCTYMLFVCTIASSCILWSSGAHVYLLLVLTRVCAHLCACAYTYTNIPFYILSDRKHQITTVLRLSSTRILFLEGWI